jgi:hypothetical protein
MRSDTLFHILIPSPYIIVKITDYASDGQILAVFIILMVIF